MKHKIRVSTAEGEKVILVNKEEYGDLISELGGYLPYIREFETTNGEIITSDMIYGIAGESYKSRAFM